MRTRWVMEFLGVGLAFLLSAEMANAQFDSDADLVPDGADNCVLLANGPNDASNQVDADGDGYGNVCDADFDQSGYVGLTDYNAMWACFGGSSCPTGFFFPAIDLDGDGFVLNSDLIVLLGQLGAPFDAVSGLPCADPTLRTILIGGPDPVCTP